MSIVQDGIARFKAQRPVVRVAVALVGALVAYTFLDDYPWALARAWSAEADHVQRVLHEGARNEEELPGKIRDAIAVFGRLDLPGSEAEGANALSIAVKDAAKKNKVTSYTFQTRTGGKLPKAASDAAGITSRVERLIGEVNFVASPQDTFGFIQALEASPAVDAIGSVRMDWDDKAKKLSVRLMAEAWVTSGRTKGS
jgi:hypothetical protein